MHPVHARTAPFSEAINEALHIAATMNASAIVSVLMQAGANPLAILDDATGDTALHEAARRGHVHACRTLVHEAGEQRQQLLNAQNKLCVTQGKPLEQYASSAAFAKAVAAAGAGGPREECYPLTSACKSGELMAARCLIQVSFASPLSQI
jgi:hypothetical protein